MTACSHSKKIPVTSHDPIFELPDAEQIKAKDFKFLSSKFEKPTTVLLGESIHITKEFPLFRIAIIDYLNRYQNYSWMLLEGSPVEFWVATEAILNENSNTKLARQISFFGLWQSEQMQQLWTMSQASAQTDKPLYLTSFDVQIGQGRASTAKQIDLFKSLMLAIPKYGVTLTNKKIEMVTSKLQPLLQCRGSGFPKNTQQFEEATKAVNEIAEAVSKVDFAKYADTPFKKHHMIALKTLPKSLTKSIEFCRLVHKNRNQKDGESYSDLRDRMMAEQFLWQQKNLGIEKAILWAHSAHINYSKSKRVPMGYYLKESGISTYSITLTAGRGVAVGFLDDTGNEIDPIEQELLRLDRVTFEKKLSERSNRDFYLDFSEILSGNPFYSSEMTGRSEPRFATKLIPSLSFDAVIFVQSISPTSLDF